MSSRKSLQQVDNAPFDRCPRFDLNASIVHLLHRAGQRSGEQFVSLLGHRELTPRQFAVMTAAAGRDGATQSNLIEDTGIDRSTMVDVVRRLIKRGWLSRRRSRTDARAYVIRVTQEGKHVLHAATAEAADVDQAILAVLSPADRQALIRFLSLLVHDMDRVAAPAETARNGLRP